MKCGGSHQNFKSTAKIAMPFLDREPGTLQVCTYVLCIPRWLASWLAPAAFSALSCRSHRRTANLSPRTARTQHWVGLPPAHQALGGKGGRNGRKEWKEETEGRKQ